MPHTNVPRSSCGGGYETGTATTCATRPAASTSSHSFLPLADRDETSRRSPGRPASQKSKMPWLPGFLPVEIDIQAGELYGGRHDCRRPCRPCSSARARLGMMPRSASGTSRSQVAPSSPSTTALPVRSLAIDPALYRYLRAARSSRKAGGWRGRRRIQ